MEGFQGNLPTPHQLQAIAGLTDAQAAAYCFASPETYRRWKRDRKPNPAALRLLAIRAGWVPWPGWEKYLFCRVDGRFYHDDLRDGFEPGDLPRVHWLEQALRARERPFRVDQGGGRLENSQDRDRGRVLDFPVSPESGNAALHHRGTPNVPQGLVRVSHFPRKEAREMRAPEAFQPEPEPPRRAAAGCETGILCSTCSVHRQAQGAAPVPAAARRVPEPPG
ncbi:MAG: hypothetical protein WD750_13175, partial [Gammaproteobacteria bacterium]